MVTSSAGRTEHRPLDTVALDRVTRRLLRAPDPPWLHGEVARRMAERLPLIRLQPQRVIDWGAFLGASRQALQRAYPGARVVAVEADAWRREATNAALAAPWWSPLRRRSARAERAIAPAELGPGQAELLWANMQLHGAIAPQTVMAQWLRVLSVDGFLMFSTLGPGSLLALRELYAGQGWPAPFAPFVDMHDLGDMLVEAGFADPVMDQESITLTWPSAEALLAELRGLGGNVEPRRHAGLRTPRWRSRLIELLTATADAAGRVPLGFELVYGHAFKPPLRPRLAAQTTLPLEDMRTLIRAGRRP
jgi:malonyl-CoA O-methyltransferase